EALASALTRGKGGKGGTTVASALDPEPLLKWAESAPKLLGKPLLIWAARALALVNVGLVGTAWLGVLPAGYLLPPPALSLLVLSGARRDAQAAFEAVATREGALSGYDELLEAIETSSANAALLAELRARLRQGDATPSRAMGQLRTAVSYFELRYQGL